MQNSIKLPLKCFLSSFENAKIYNMYNVALIESALIFNKCTAQKPRTTFLPVCQSAHDLAK
jgi:hypothetical protein